MRLKLWLTMLSKVKFKIADITFQFSSSYAKPIQWVKEHYGPYISDNSPSDLDISLIFRKGYRNSKILDEISGDHSKGKVKVVSNYNLGIADLTRTLFSMAIVKKGGLLLHASAIADGNISFVFCGPSESGKTTIARLLQKKDVLTDETTAIVNKGNRYYAYATPFFGELGDVSKNRGAPVKAIFFLHKGDGFLHKRINKVEAMKHFLYNMILRSRNLELAEKVLDNVSNLIDRVPCYELYFKPDVELWRYINDIA